MKKIFFGSAFVLALGGAMLTNSSSQAAAQKKFAPIMFTPSTCVSHDCSSTTNDISCKDLKQTSCSGLVYTGNLRYN